MHAHGAKLPEGKFDVFVTDEGGEISLFKQVDGPYLLSLDSKGYFFYSFMTFIDDVPYSLVVEEPHVTLYHIGEQIIEEYYGDEEETDENIFDPDPSDAESNEK